MTTLNIYYLRHGHACNNVSKYFRTYSGPILPEHDMYIPDGILTNKGLQQCKILNKKIKIIPDLVITSELVRTIETGLEIFKSKIDKLYVVPFISEKRLKKAFNSDIDERAFQYDILSRYLEKRYSADYPKVDFSIMRDFIIPSENVENLKNLKIEPNEDKLFKILIPYLINRFNLKNNANIFIISHANYLNHHFKKRHNGNLPKYNNAELRSERVVIKGDELSFDNLILYQPIFYDNHAVYRHILYDNHDLTKLERCDIERCFVTNTGYKLKHAFDIYKIDGTFDHEI
jgi:hypothetical protein